MQYISKRLAAYNDLPGYQSCKTPPPSIRVAYPVKVILDKKYDTIIKVTCSDTLDATKDLIKSGRNPLVLNMTCINKPGGGWEKGTCAQEESLFYRTNYYQTLTQEFYPIKDAVGVYSSDVTVFRNNVLYNMPQDNRWNASFMAIAAIRKPVLDSKTGRLNKTDYMLTEQKIELMYQMGIFFGHDSLVLSAFGCGAYSNPPDDIVEIFNNMNQKYYRCFHTVCFAIISAEEETRRYNGYFSIEDRRRYIKNISRCNYNLFKKKIKTYFDQPC